MYGWAHSSKPGCVVALKHPSASGGLAGVRTLQRPSSQWECKSYSSRGPQVGLSWNSVPWQQHFSYHREFSWVQTGSNWGTGWWMQSLHSFVYKTIPSLNPSFFIALWCSFPGCSRWAEAVYLILGLPCRKKLPLAYHLPVLSPGFISSVCLWLIWESIVK